MKKIMIGLIVLIITITIVISSSNVNFDRIDDFKNYAGIPPVKVPPIPPPSK